MKKKKTFPLMQYQDGQWIYVGEVNENYKPPKEALTVKEFLIVFGLGIIFTVALAISFYVSN